MNRLASVIQVSLFSVLLLLTIAAHVSDSMPSVVSAQTTIYYRPFNLIYATQGGKVLSESDATILTALSSFPTKPTMLTPVLVNRDPDKHATFISNLKTIVPNLCFAEGDSSYNLTNTADLTTMLSLAKQYLQYTNCIRLDHFNSLVVNSGEKAVVSFLTKLHNKGFQHIIVNPWQNRQSGNDWPYVDAAQIAVDGTTWQARTDRIQGILSQSPGATVVVNYENPTQQLALTGLGAQGSIDAMSIAADQQTTSSVPFRWMPPWSPNYDPYQLNTLSWVANKLAQVDP